jgi:hypothetical protein
MSAESLLRRNLAGVRIRRPGGAVHRHQADRHVYHRRQADLALAWNNYNEEELQNVMKKNLITAVLMTIATTVLLGILYPLLVTGLAQLIFPKQANGELIQRDGVWLVRG